MQSSLVPERPLIISPTLAATIGLEEAVMLHVLAELMNYQQGEYQQGLTWLRLDQTDLCTAMPFWTWMDIRRVQKNLQDLGLILIEPLAADTTVSRYAINQTQANEPSAHGQHAQAAAPTPAAVTSVQQYAANTQANNHIAPNWQPGDDCLQQCRQQNIPEDFVYAQVPGFVLYWRERGQARFSWGMAFYKHVLKEWRMEQTRRGASQLDSVMSAQWWPSQDAVEILQNAGISTAFIEDCVPEFVLYWRERGIVDAAWNSKFIDHIRRQWNKYSAALEHDGLPRPIAADWQPSADCFDILRLAEIDEDYARDKVKEFVLYWRDTRQVNASWNTQFLKYIKFNWAKRLDGLQDVGADAKNRLSAGQSGTGLDASFQRFTDRSWAD